MGFPRQKVKARWVAPSKSGDERVSKSLFFPRRLVPDFMIEEMFLTFMNSAFLGRRPPTNSCYPGSLGFVPVPLPFDSRVVSRSVRGSPPRV